MSADADAAMITLGERSLGLEAVEAALAGKVRVALHPEAIARCMMLYCMVNDRIGSTNR